MGITTDRNDPELHQHVLEGPGSGQQRTYLVLNEEERKNGWIRPLRTSYVHNACGRVTRMGMELCETYAREPKFYGKTFCVGCRAHLPVCEFRWVEDNEVVGS